MRLGPKPFTLNVPMVISDSDPLIKKDCIVCHEPCDQRYGDVTGAKRYNLRGNMCVHCDNQAGVNAWERLHPLAAFQLKQRAAQ